VKAQKFKKGESNVNVRCVFSSGETPESACASAGPQPGTPGTIELYCAALRWFVADQMRSRGIEVVLVCDLLSGTMKELKAIYLMNLPLAFLILSVRPMRCWPCSSCHHVPISRALPRTIVAQANQLDSGLLNLITPTSVIARLHKPLRVPAMIAGSASSGRSFCFQYLTQSWSRSIGSKMMKRVGGRHSSHYCGYHQAKGMRIIGNELHANQEQAL
jgi:hypothetical protein